MMKSTLLGFGLLLGLCGAALADPAEGIWQTEKDDNGNFGQVQVTTCGAKICGTLIKSFNPDGSELASENIGKPIIWDMEPQGDGAYAKGKIWSPDRNKTYNSKMQLSGDSLSVSGCVLGICRDGGTWKRVK